MTAPSVMTAWKRVGGVYLAIAVVAMLTALVRGSHETDKDTPTPASIVAIPDSVRKEHEGIHAALEEAMRAPGRVGAAAGALGQVLHPHFLREEEIALPPLGLLAPLAAGGVPPGAAEVLAMTDALRAELPQMLAEHVKIRAAVEALRAAARADHEPRFEELADQLALHAQTEEEVLYPAAVLVGDILRARSASRRFPFDKQEQKP